MIDICDFAVGQSRHALRPDDSIRAAEPSPDGAVASARRRRHHLGLQFSRRGLVVERGARGGLRRLDDLEAVARRRRSPRSRSSRSRSASAGTPALIRRSSRSLIGDGPTRRADASRPTRACRLSPRRARRGWASKLRRRCTAGSARASSSSAATTRSSSRKTADLDMAARAIFFGAVGTAGQRCTSTRRVIAHESVADELRDQLLSAYKSVRIGNPLDRNTLIGPADRSAIGRQRAAVDREGERRRRRDSLRRREAERLRVPGRLLHAPVPRDARGTSSRS